MFVGSNKELGMDLIRRLLVMFGSNVRLFRGDKDERSKAISVETAYTLGWFIII
jgi:hypothetical protein